MKTNSAYHGRYVQSADGAQLFVEETGDPTKPTLFWIHGYCQSRLSWDYQFTDEQLAAQFHMVRVDLRGHGLSDKPNDPQVFRESKNWADDVQAVINELNLHKPVLAGWSYGGYIMCDYIRHYGQDNLGGLIFVSAVSEMGRDEANAMLGMEFLQLVPGFFSNDYTEGSIALQKFMEMATYEEMDAHSFYFYLGFNAVTLPAARVGMFTREIDNRALMQTITVPSLIVQGNQDRIVLPTFADHIARHISHAARANYDRCGHAAFAEYAVQFNSDVAAFMGNVSG